MKKILMTIGAVGITVGAFAQGTVLFDNDSSGEVDVLFNASQTPAQALGQAANPGPGGTWHVALLYNATSGGGIAQTAFTEVDDYIPNTANNAIDGTGSFEQDSGGKEQVITVPNPGKATFEVVSWIGTATTWFGVNGVAPVNGVPSNAAFATQGANLVEFTGTAANPNAAPPGVAQSINATGWNGSALLTVVPEPSIMALGGLGAAALLGLRRRK